MDLALELGYPFEQLARVMTEREFRWWRQYAMTRLLPTRRLEFYLAQLTLWVARSQGAKGMTVLDFMHFAPEEREEAEDDLDAIRKEFDYKPRTLSTDG